MKKLIISITLIFVLLLGATSCDKSELKGTDYFKTSQSFDNFLWKKNKPDTLKAYINTEFSECQTLKEPLVLQLCDDDALAIPPSVAQLYVNGSLSPDNTVSIKPYEKAGKTEIWIVLGEEQLKSDRTFTWNLQVVENPGLLRINEVDPTSIPWVPNTTVNWKNDHVANTLEVTFWTVICILAAIFVALVLFMRMMRNPAFRVRKMTYGSEDFQKSLLLSGVGRVVFSTKQQSQSFFNRLFTRKTLFVINDFFTAGDVIVTPKDRIMTESGRRNGARIQAKNYTTSNLTITKDETVIITNVDTQRTIELTIIQ